MDHFRHREARFEKSQFPAIGSHERCRNRRRTADGSNPVPRSTENPCQQQYGSEMNDGRRRKRFAGLCRIVSDGYVGDEGYDDEL
jgi:hypothetical protein